MYEITIRGCQLHGWSLNFISIVVFWNHLDIIHRNYHPHNPIQPIIRLSRNTTWESISIWDSGRCLRLVVIGLQNKIPKICIWYEENWWTYLPWVTSDTRLLKNYICTAIVLQELLDWCVCRFWMWCRIYRRRCKPALSLGVAFQSTNIFAYYCYWVLHGEFVWW